MHRHRALEGPALDGARTQSEKMIRKATIAAFLFLAIVFALTGCRARVSLVWDEWAWYAHDPPHRPFPILRLEIHDRFIEVLYSRPIATGLPTGKEWAGYGVSCSRDDTLYEGTWYRAIFVRASDLALLAVSVLLTIYPAGALIWSVHVRRSRRRAHACLACGYDLTGNTSGICPECGTELATLLRVKPMHWFYRAGIAIVAGLALAPVVFYLIANPSSDISLVHFVARTFSLPLGDYLAFIAYGAVAVGVYSAVTQRWGPAQSPRCPTCGRRPRPAGSSPRPQCTAKSEL
jgi:hypothetical protein